MKKISQVLKLSAIVIGTLWLCLTLLTISAMMVGNEFFSSGRSHVHSANIALIWDDQDTAIVELRKAANDGLIGNRIAVGVYTSGQILLPFMWNEFAELRANAFTEIDKINKDLNTILLVKTE